MTKIRLALSDYDPTMLWQKQLLAYVQQG